MVGAGKKLRRPRNTPHPGMTIALKGAESVLFMRFALCLLESHGGRVKGSADMMRAGNSLIGWLNLSKAAPARLPRDTHQALLDAAARVA
eukprot:2281448-Pyramimonas_sp.AAC.1